MTDDAAAVPVRRRALWRNRDYRLLWSGNLVSSIGTAMVTVALPLLIVAITGEPLQAGGVAAVETLPYIALSLPIGLLVDRYNRRRMLIFASVLALVASSIIPIAYHYHHLTIGMIYVAAALVGVAASLDQIAQVAVLPRLVATDQVEAAAGQAELVFNVSSLIGPPLAGLLLAGTHIATPFVIDSLSFGVLAVTVGLIRTDVTVTREATGLGWREELTLGFRSLYAQPQLRALTIITLCGDFLFSGITVLMTLLVRSRGASPTIIGAVFALAAIGGIAGSLMAGRVHSRMGLVRSVILRGWATAILFSLLAVGVPPVVLGVVWGAMNIMIAYMNVIQMGLTVKLVSEDVLGRTQSVVTFGSFAVLPLGAVFAGALLQYAGPRGTVLVITAMLALVALYSTVSRDLRTKPEPTADPD